MIFDDKLAGALAMPGSAKSSDSSPSPGTPDFGELSRAGHELARIKLGFIVEPRSPDYSCGHGETDKVGRPDVDQFEAVMARENRPRGFFVVFGYTSDAERECAAFHKRTGRIIKLLTVQEILDEEHVQKM